MTRIEHLLRRLRDAGARVPRLTSPYSLKAPTFGPGCHEAEINELQGKQWPLPDDYREFLSHCRRIDASDVHNGYFIFSPIDAVTNAGPQVLHVDRSGCLDEVHVSKIGGDGGGNMFLIGRSPNAIGAVWKWDHEHPYRVDGVAREGLQFVAESFTDFLGRVADDWEHFVDGDQSWRYVSG